jgi:hypothetical protein
LLWRVEIHSSTTRNFAPSQYPTNPDTTTPKNAYANLQPVLTIADRAKVRTRIRRIPWNRSEFRRRARTMPGPRPYLVVSADVPGSTGRYDATAAETARYWIKLGNCWT